MKIYLCSRYSRREQMRSVRDELQRIGHEVTSSWIDTEFELTEQGSSAAPPDLREYHAQRDMEDLREADVIWAFTERARSDKGRGGRHVEYGMAIAWGKRLIVIGHRENIFHHLPNAEFFESQWDAVRALSVGRVSEGTSK